MALFNCKVCLHSYTWIYLFCQVAKIVYTYIDEVQNNFIFPTPSLMQEDVVSINALLYKSAKQINVSIRKHIHFSFLGTILVGI